MHINGSKTRPVYLRSFKQPPRLFMKPVAKVKVNIMAYGYANNSVATIGNGIDSNTDVDVIRNGHV